MVHVGAIAVIAAELAAVVHLQLAAAMTAAQESCEKHFALAYRASGNRPSHAGRIVGDIELELVPGDVALVLILEQHAPFGQLPARNRERAKFCVRRSLSGGPGRAFRHRNSRSAGPAAAA